MAQTLNLKVKGLVTHPNTLNQENYPGALSIADNIVIDKENLAESRRGFSRYGFNYLDLSDNTKAINSLYNYKDFILVSYDNKIAYESDHAGSWVDYTGTYSPAESGTKIRSVESNKNFYINTSEGVLKLAEVAGSFTQAGVPKALDGEATLDTDYNGWFNTNKTVAYRLVWGIKDINQNLILGTPSSRIIIQNVTGSDCFVNFTYTVPDGITTNHFYQLYRTTAVGINETPNDEMQLVVESNPTSTEITNKEISFVDATPTDLRGATLYTSPSQQGIENANDIPPFCTDMCVYKDSLFFANTRTKHRIRFNILAAGGTGIGLGDVVSIDGVSVTGGAVENASGYVFMVGSIGYVISSGAVNTGTDKISISSHGFSDNDIVNLWSDDTLPAPLAVKETYFIVNKGTNDFQLSLTAGGAAIDLTSAGAGNIHICALPASVSDGLEQTAISLVKTINKSPTNTKVYAYYTTGDEDIPGQILLEGRSVSGAAFTVSSTNPDAFSPKLSSLTSDNETRINRVYISKAKQPESVPLYSYLDVGSADKAIVRILSLRDSVFIFKKDGIYRITGEDYSTFRVSLFDNTTELLAPESAVPFNNQVFAMTLQGVVAVSDTGVAVVSRSIEYDLLQLITYPSFASTCFGLSYESERKFILFTVASTNQTYPTQAYVYNSFTNTWTRWTLNATCGLVHRYDDKMYLGGKGYSQLGEWVYKERKSFSSEDYVDDDSGCQIISINGNVLQLDRVEDAVVGYGIRQVLYPSNEKVLAKITAIDYDNFLVTVDDATGFTTSVQDLVTIYKPITCRLRWLPQHADNPGVLKHFREITLFFRQYTGTDLNIGFETNFRPDYDSVVLDTLDVGQWGTFNWGTLPWGGVGNTFMQALRTYIPLEKQRASWINISVEGTNCFSSFSLAGVSMIFEPMSEKFRR